MIRSNIRAVMGRMERLEAAIPVAVAKGVEVQRWHLPLKNAARMAVQAVALPGEERWVNSFAEAVLGAVTGKGVRWTLDARMAALVPDVSGATSLVKEGFGTRGRRVSLEQGSREAASMKAVREGILQWVQEEKRRDPVDDAGLTDEELAERIQWIMGVHPRSRAGSQTEGMAEAAVGLGRAVQGFLEQEHWQQGGLEPARIGVWLRAVQVVWREKLMLELPQVVRQEIRKQWRTIRDSML